MCILIFFFFSSRRRHTRLQGDWSSDVCSSDLLNEATSDIFGACVDARAKGEDAGQFNWLIGEDVVADDLYGEAIRSMAFPGSAYDDSILGTDPQPATMAGYVPGGDPHVNSGIVNRWFYLMATDLGIEPAALIWYATLQKLWPTAQFADAAY